MINNTRRITMSAMFLALGLVLPFFTGQIPQIGKMLLPMHIPVFLCSLVCGWKYGAIVGFILPIMRSMLFSMPIMFPTAVAMAFELLTYGLVTGILYERSNKKQIRDVYIPLVTAMIAGRGVWGIVNCIVLGIETDFWAVAFVNGVPGIILQLILVPTVFSWIRSLQGEK